MKNIPILLLIIVMVIGCSFLGSLFSALYVQSVAEPMEWEITIESEPVTDYSDNITR